MDVQVGARFDMSEELITDKPYWWYVLFVRGGTENRVVEETNRYVSMHPTPYKIKAFVLESEQYYRDKKYQQLGRRYRKRPLFPGYVFIETDMPDKDFLQTFHDYIYKSNCIIKVLRSGNKNSLAIAEEERISLQYWCLGYRCLTHSEGYIEGDKIIVTSGPLVGQEGLIKKINRHNCTADIEISLFNQKQTIKVALEIVSKIIV